MRSSITSLLLFWFALTCDLEPGTRVEPDLELQCVVDVCSVLSRRAPIVPNHRLRWTWDWRTNEACVATMSCGSRMDACRAAVDAVPQVGPGSEPEVSDAAIYRVWHACREISGAGGQAPSREKQ